MSKYPPRRADPGARITYHDRQDGEVTLHADDEGVVRPRTEAQHRVADALDLPVARSVIEADEAAEKAAAKASTRSTPAGPAEETRP